MIICLHAPSVSEVLNYCCQRELSVRGMLSVIFDRQISVMSSRLEFSDILSMCARAFVK
jgi:hypothetical protein